MEGRCLNRCVALRALLQVDRPGERGGPEQPAHHGGLGRHAGDPGGAGVRRRRLHVRPEQRGRQRDPRRAPVRARAALRAHQRARLQERAGLPPGHQRELGARLRRQQPRAQVHRAEARSV